MAGASQSLRSDADQPGRLSNVEVMWQVKCQRSLLITVGRYDPTGKPFGAILLAFAQLCAYRRRFKRSKPQRAPLARLPIRPADIGGFSHGGGVGDLAPRSALKS
jgi:hypothetical protein